MSICIIELVCFIYLLYNVRNIVLKGGKQNFVFNNKIIVVFDLMNLICKYVKNYVQVIKLYFKWIIIYFFIFIWVDYYKCICFFIKKLLSVYGVLIVVSL